MREKWDRQQSGSTYGAITVQNAVNTCRGGYDPGEYFRQQAAREFMPTPAGPLSLVDIAPEDNQRYGLNDIGNGNLFADWYKAVSYTHLDVYKRQPRSCGPAHAPGRTLPSVYTKRIC